MKNVLLVNALLVILFLSDTYGGRVHDLRIAEGTPYPLTGPSMRASVGWKWKVVASRHRTGCSTCTSSPQAAFVERG